MTCTPPCKWCEKDALREAVIDAARVLADAYGAYGQDEILWAALNVVDAVQALDAQESQ